VKILLVLLAVVFALWLLLKKPSPTTTPTVSPVEVHPFEPIIGIRKCPICGASFAVSPEGFTAYNAHLAAHDSTIQLAIFPQPPMPVVEGGGGFITVDGTKVPL
jgi:hypothetical protein